MKIIKTIFYPHLNSVLDGILGEIFSNLVKPLRKLLEGRWKSPGVY